MIQLGPLLGFKNSTDDRWNVSVLVVTTSNATPALELNTSEQADVSAPVKVHTHHRSHVWKWDLSVVRPASGEAAVTYIVEGETNLFHVPAAEMPLQMAFVSCNGYSNPADGKHLPRGADQLDRWYHLVKKHLSDRERAPKSHFHLLLMGGDQIYGDSVLVAIPELHRWSSLNRTGRINYKVSKELAIAIEQHYFEDIYLHRWSKEPMNKAMASIPTLMMWDDHDVIDGWGSIDQEEARCEVYQAIYATARRYFRLFQMRLPPADESVRPYGHLGSGNNLGSFQRIGDVGILTLDLRSERNQQRILSASTWTLLSKALEKDGVIAVSGIKHLLVKSSIPVVYPSFEWLEKLLGIMPGTQTLEDDLRDHWRSLPHKGERRRLIHHLLAFANRASCRVTLLSGDVHVPAFGELQSKRIEHGSGRSAVIYQLISSGIVHPSAGAIVTYALDKILSNFREEVEQDIVAQMLEMPDTGRKLLPQRNWLALEFDKSHALWAKWWLEGNKDPVVKVIHSA